MVGMEVIAVCQIFLLCISQTHGNITLPILCGWLGVYLAVMKTWV